MNTEKRMIHSYEVVSSFRIGGKEVVFAMDEKNTDGEKYMTCFVERDELFERYNECLLSDDYAEIETLIPWIALILLLFIGGKMLIEVIKNKESEEESSGVGFGALLIQGIATSIDALSVGFTISDYGFVMALVCSLLIAAVTFTICMAGLFIGRKFGTKLANKASILGGAILVFIGLEIWITGVFF